MFEYLDLLFPKNVPFDNTRYEWLTNSVTKQPLEIDRYYPELKVGFEFQGEQHFRQVSGMGNYNQIAHLDDLKRKLCKKERVLLVAIRPIDLRSIELKKMCKKVSGFTGVKRYRFDAKTLNHSALHGLDIKSIDYRNYLMERYPESEYVYV